MEIFRHKSFKKQYKKLPEKIKIKFKERIHIFLNNPYDPALNNHALSGDLKKYRSINITGDIRAWYEPHKEKIVFIKIGSHSELHG